MDLNGLKKPLDVADIDFRVQSMGKASNGKVWCILLAYKDARVDMNRLNEICGIDGWQKKYELIDGQLFCSVGVYSDKLKQWIWKQDVGTESNTEKEKGRASDSFKRACFNLGIGIELYDMPMLFCYLNQGEYYEQNSKVKQGKSLKLNRWKWAINRDSNGKIINVIGQDDKGNERVKGF